LKIGIVIPARLESKRLPNKVLKYFFNKPMIEHVWRRARLVKPEIEIVIATDSYKIARICESFGAKVFITSSAHPNGLSRVGEVAKMLKWDFYVVLQADEILIKPENLEKLIIAVQKNKNYDFYNLITKLDDGPELNDINVVKCLVRENNSIITIFRKSGSISRQEIQFTFTRKICGVYAISKNALNKTLSSSSKKIETSESIEQMKIIEIGLEILGVPVKDNYPSVNTQKDVSKVLNIAKNDKKQKSIFASTK